MKELTEVRSLKEGRYMMIDDEPCTILSISTSKPGKHGSAKARIDAMGIFDRQKRSVVQPVTAKVYVPIIKRKTAQVLSIVGDTVQLMDLGDYSTLELNVPPEARDKLSEGKEITYLEGMGQRKLDR